MLEAFANLNAALYVGIVLVFFLFEPVILVYVAFRVLRDLRRIAVALEARAEPERYTPDPVQRVYEPAPPALRPGISLSQFGR